MHDIYYIGRQKPAMRALKTHVIPNLAGNWRDLGWQLLNNEHTHVIDEIDGLSGVQLCAELLFDRWLNFDYETCTWDQIIESLGTIGLNALAKNLKTKLSSGELPGIVTDTYKSVAIQVKRIHVYIRE